MHSQTSNAAPKCPYCGSAFLHQGVCPTVKAIEYYPDGTVKRVELKTANDYPQQVIAAPSVFGTVPEPLPDAPSGARGYVYRNPPR